MSDVYDDDNDDECHGGTSFITALCYEFAGPIILWTAAIAFVLLGWLGLHFFHLHVAGALLSFTGVMCAVISKWRSNNDKGSRYFNYPEIEDDVGPLLASIFRPSIAIASYVSAIMGWWRVILFALVVTVITSLYL